MTKDNQDTTTAVISGALIALGILGLIGVCVAAIVLGVK